MKGVKLIVGLGNPGKEYENTRHNVGFEVLDALMKQVVADRLGNTPMNRSVSLSQLAEWRYERKFEGEMVRVGEVLLLKPMTFMNRTGVSIKKVKNFYKIKSENIWVIHDDLDIRLGEFKIQLGKGPKKHNGVLSVERELGTKDFWRVRVGVESRENRLIPGEKYVLMKLSEEEKGILKGVIERVVRELEYRI